MLVITNGVNTKHWIEASKDLKIYSYMPGVIGTDLTEGLSSKPTLVEQGQSFTRGDFQTSLKKVSQRRSAPIGENVRDAIRSIKGR